MKNGVKNLDEIVKRFATKKLILFLDYDGTLSPIVSDPKDAIISKETREILNKISKVITCSIVSGRQREDVSNRVKIDSLYYAGSHGFDITGPKNSNFKFSVGLKYKSILQNYFDEVTRRFVPGKKMKWNGMVLENNKFSLSVHYRMIKETNAPEEILKVLKEILAKDAYKDDLKMTFGKKVYEIRPKLDWDKGKAILKILEEMKLKDSKKVFCIYLGDDKTDEDAFAELNTYNLGIGLLVTKGKDQQDIDKSNSSYLLDDVNDVNRFLSKLYEHFSKK